MGRGDLQVGELRKCIKGWEFLALQLDGLFGGIIIGWTHNTSLTNSYAAFLGL
jgi:hypothetical protein